MRAMFATVGASASPSAMLDLPIEAAVTETTRSGSEVAPAMGMKPMAISVMPNIRESFME